MFSNIVPLYYDHTHSLGNVALVDGPTNRKTLRSGIAVDSSILELSIAHQSTNENPGQETTRSNVRLAQTRTSATTGKPVTTYVQFTMSHNDAADCVGDPVKLFGALMAFLLTGGDTAPASGEDYSADASNIIKRLTQGEP